MKILHVIQMMKKGGAQRTLINIIKATLFDFEHSVVSTQCEFMHELETLGIDYYDYSKTNIYMLINRIRPQVIHFHWWPETETYDFKKFREKLKLSYRVISTIQDPEPIQKDFADYYVSCSKYVFMKQPSYVRKRGEIVLDYIDNEQFFGLKMIRRHKEINVIRHSMIYENKIDKEIITRIYNCIKKIQPLSSKKINFIICGDGDDFKKELQEYVYNNLDETIIFKNGSEILNVLEKGDIYLYTTPSNSYEGYSNCISEAEASALPIIADKKGGNIEQIGSKNGFLCSNWDEIERALKLLIIDQDLRESMGRESRILVKKRGNLGTLGKKYRMIYKMVGG